MAKKAGFYGGATSGTIVSDRDWITIIGALLKDKSAESKQLANKLMDRTRHGRQIAFLRIIRDRKPRLVDLKRHLKVSRRTLFRYLNHLEADGVQFSIDGEFRYQVEKIPPHYQRVL